MAWIESHQDLEEHPKILLLCNKTGWNLDEAIGKLHRLWWWTLKYAEDGDLSKYDPSQFLVRLNSKLSSKELYKALQEANFIEKNGLIHDWLDYAGRYLTTKYRTSNPNRLQMIEKKYESVKSRTKGRLKSDTVPTVPTVPNQPKEQPSAALKAVLDKICKEGLNIYSLINQLKKELKWRKDQKFPDEVLLAVCEQYSKDKAGIKDPWPWFKRVIEEKSKDHFAQQNIAEHEKLKKEGITPLKDLLKSF